MGMGVPFYIIVVALVISTPQSSSTLRTLSKGSSLSVEKTDDVLISENGFFSAGFYSVGDNAYCFAIWYTQPMSDGNLTAVWMANRNNPFNRRYSKLSLLRTGNLELTDADQFSIWSTNTRSTSSVKLQLNNTGNLVLYTSSGDTLWQSFGSPTNTLLPDQPLTKDTALISSRSRTNYSSGFYQLFFDSDNTLRLQFNGRDTTSVYWFDPWLRSWEAGRTSYNSSRFAVLDSFGHFYSSDQLSFVSTDEGLGILRRLTLDFDGNIRLYSLRQKKWEVTWQAIQQPCKIHGVCGPNMLCTYDHVSGRRCSCVPGYKIKNDTDWSYGCEPMFEPCQSGVNTNRDGFVMIRRSEFYGYDIGYFPNYTFRQCKEKCLKTCSCKGFNYKYDGGSGHYICYPKVLLLNGYQMGFHDPVYIRIPKTILKAQSKSIEDMNLHCSAQSTVELSRTYKKKKDNGVVKFMLWFFSALGGLEILVIITSLYVTRQPARRANKDYQQLGNTGFRRFTYAELKKASGNFKEEIGRGSGGVVYKGLLANNRVAAIKRLKEANQGEAEFLTEVSTIGRLHHMNLIDIWGYCVDGKHRLLVYEYMNHGSLAGSLGSGILNWEKRFNIAVGTAKGLAYLHEECLEWVLHCDVKPHNILLDADYNPKVADFGLSKLLNRGGIGNSSFSKIRGTRGYMAPEWVFNLPITSKVDVYSYGVVMLEMITGRSPSALAGDNSGELVQRRLVTWVREKMREFGMGSWIEEIVDPTMNGEYDMGRLEILVKVAVQCAEEDREARPTMSEVVDMLLRQEEDH